jgi:glycosyltransferase involved in cell wall biosynthesis
VKISCIIPTLERPKSLERTLRSLDAQTQPPDEVIVVMQRHSPPIPDEHWRFPLVAIRQEEPNAQRARNAAARRATGDLLLFLDDDIEAEAGLIKKYLDAFQDAKLGAACGAILEPGQSPVSQIPDECRDEPVGWTKFPLNYGEDSPTRNFSSCNTCVRRDIQLASGGFDEHFVATLFDDSDWSVRLCREMEERGLTGMHLGKIRLTHFRDPAGGRRIERISTFVKVDAEGWASRLYFWRKNYGITAWREIARFLRMDLLCGSLLVRPRELVRAWAEFGRGWKLASERMEQGPKLLTNP